ncbi:MAG: hypothetical protein IJ677_08925 [Alphaproteobacteria bacterium]|nr:hypothetical protein [Alphaproteobacteria bacterium]
MTDWNLDNLTKEEFDAMYAITEGQDHRPEPSYAEIRSKVREMRWAKKESNYRIDREIERAEFRGDYAKANDLRERKELSERLDKKFEKDYYAQREVNRAKTRREKAFRERNQDGNIHTKSRIDGLKALLLGTAATVIAGAAGIAYTLSNSKKENKDPEDSKNKKEVVLPSDNKNVIEVEGDIDDAKAAELVNDYKKQHAAEKGKDNNNGQTYYIVVKNSKKQGR